MWTVVIVAALGGCGRATFQCEDDADCLRGGRSAGTCEAVGYCSFPDPGCVSGQRFGEASAGFAGECVPEAPFDPTETGGGGTSSGDPGSTSGSSTALESTTEGGSSSGTDPGDESTTESVTTGPNLDADLSLWLDFEPGEADKSTYAHPVSCAATCPSGTAGVFDAGAAFDADYLEVAAHPALDFSGAFTLSVWFRADGMNPLGRGTIVAQEYRPVATSYDISVQDLDGAPPYDLVLGSEGTASAVPNIAELGVWSFLAVRVDAGQQQVFVNGEEVLLAGLQPPPSQLAPVFIGGSPSIPFSFIGAVDDLRVHRRILTDAELVAVRDGELVE